MTVVAAALKILTKERRDVPVRISSMAPVSVKKAKQGQGNNRRSNNKRYQGKRGKGGWNKGRNQGGRNRKGNFQKRRNHDRSIKESSMLRRRFFFYQIII